MIGSGPLVTDTNVSTQPASYLEFHPLASFPIAEVLFTAVTRVQLLKNVITITVNEEQIPDATGKLKNYKDFDNVLFKLKQATALSTDITSRLAWEPAFEAIIDAGK